MSTRGHVLTLNVGERLVTETCYSCGVLFAMAEDYRDHRLKDGKNFHCPSGHSQAYVQGKTDEQKLREASARETALKDQLSAAIRDAETTRAALIRDRHRFANGVCPCCNRSFDNVRRHMTTKHPDYDVTQVKQPAHRKFTCSCGRAFTTPRGLAIHQGHRRSDGWDKPSASPYYAHLTKV